MGWGIENGTHQRLDVSLNEDRCRVRSANGLWILGYAPTSGDQPVHALARTSAKPKTLTDLQAAMGEDNLTMAMAFAHTPTT